MTRTDLTEDGAVLVAALAAPGRGLAAAASRRRLLTALLAATLASLLVALVTVPRTDFARDTAARLGPEAAVMTPHQLEEAEAQATKLGALAGYAGAGFGPALAILGTGLACWLAFKVAGTRPGFRATMAVSAHALLPLFLARLLTLPAVLLQAPLAASEVPGLLPSSLAALLPASASPLAQAAASSLDLFTLWALVLLVLGMARVAGASRRRAALVVAVLWCAQVAFFKLAPAAMLAGGKGGA
jgi:Yip1-like protein